jgi:pilus assembly protein CpaC
MTQFLPTLRRALLAVAALAALAAPVPAAHAQQTVNVELGGTGPASRPLTLPRGKSAIIDLPVDARDVLVSNPAVADAVLRTPRRIYVLGVAPGQTDAVFFDAAGRQILALDIRVEQPTGAIADVIRRLVPDADVRVEPVNGALVLTGSVADAGTSDRVQRIAAQYVEKPEQILNMLTIRGSDQVQLKVRVVEIQRNAIKQLGFNTSALLGQVGEPQYLLGSLASFGVNGSILGGLTGGYQVDTTQQPIIKVPCVPGDYSNLCEVVDRNSGIARPTATAGDPGLNKANGTIQAFERAGLMRTLAEPTLTAVSGESSSFLAGGEFPVPVGLDQNGNVIVEFKPFGVSLAYTPVVMSNGRISLKLTTEVSDLSSTLTLKFNNNLTIPGIDVRRSSNTVELPSGGALMIAGLLQEKTRQNIDGVPGAKDLPVLGTLFRSRDYLSGETELVIIVEAYLVKPTTPDKLQTPADGLRIASDMDTILFGRLNKAYRKDKGEAAAPPAWRGPIGYVIE